MNVARAAYGTPTHRKTFRALLALALAAVRIIAGLPAWRACTQAGQTGRARLAPLAVLRRRAGPRRLAGRRVAAAESRRSSRARMPMASRIHAAPGAVARGRRGAR